jgi:hypothetical protein
MFLSCPVLSCPVMCRTLPCLCPSFYSSLFCRMSNVLFVTAFCLASYTAYLFYNIVSVLYHRTFSFILTMFFVSLSTSYPLSNVLHCVLCQYLSWRVKCPMCHVLFLLCNITLSYTCYAAWLLYFISLSSVVSFITIIVIVIVIVLSSHLLSSSLPTFLYLLFSTFFFIYATSPE